SALVAFRASREIAWSDGGFRPPRRPAFLYNAPSPFAGKGADHYGTLGLSRGPLFFFGIRSSNLFPASDVGFVGRDGHAENEDPQGFHEALPDRGERKAQTQPGRQEAPEQPQNGQTQAASARHHRGPARRCDEVHWPDGQGLERRIQP